LRFVTFSKDGFTRAGVLSGDASNDTDCIFDLSDSSMRSALGGVEPQMSDFVQFGLVLLADSIAKHGLSEAARLRLSQVSLKAPIPCPRRIIGVAHNYRDAIHERGIDPPSNPVLFSKNPETVIGPNAPVVLPVGVGGVTYEAELAVVIGKAGHNIKVVDALSHVAAVTAINDVSASELIRRDGYFDRGKNFPTFAPFGPYLATMDEFLDLQKLAIRFEMDGIVLQDSNTSQMLFSVVDLISILSQSESLEVGDVIATGTPAGVAAVRDPPTWLRNGSCMSVSVEGLGKLTNPIVDGDSFDA
jgi:2,4-diketo-3-deoxy-L-fuconate hydrolase